MRDGRARSCAPKSRPTPRTAPTTSRCAGFGYEEEFEGDLFGDLPRDGYRSVIEALAAGLDVRLERRGRFGARSTPTGSA